MPNPDSPSKKLEYFHVSRALAWWVLLPILVLLDAHNSVFIVLCLSIYANSASDVASWQAARAERRSLEHP
jgi:hypothetical protein